MNDKILLEDLISFQTGTGNINDYTYRTNNIKKIIKNRTNDKLYFLKYLITNNLIENDLYDELFQHVKSDYNSAYKCVLRTNLNK